MSDRAFRKVQVVGAGAWGTAITIHLAKLGRSVALWGREPEVMEEIRQAHTNSRFLPGPGISESVRVGLDGQADLLVMAVPTQYIRATVSDLRLPRVPIVSLAKGLEAETRFRPSEVFRDLLGDIEVGVLSGPSHAEEVAVGLPATLVAAAEDEAFARSLQKLFMGASLRVYTSPDLKGVELGGALKNIIAIAAGVCDGLGLGDNAKAALITRGIVEMARLGAALGADRETFFGVSGIGDLITTCQSRHGRNLRVGREIAAGRSLPDILQGMSAVAEGVWTCQVARLLAQEKGVEVPITEEVVRILHEGKDPKEAVRDLMGRIPRSEREDGVVPTDIN